MRAASVLDRRVRCIAYYGSDKNFIPILQDWPDGFVSDVAAAIAMVTNEPTDLIAKGVAEIDSPLRGGVSEDDLRTIVIEQTGRCFEPLSEELGYMQWLYRLRGNLNAQERAP